MMKIKQTILLHALLLFVVACDDTEKPEHYGQVQTHLYLGKGEHQPLIVGFGGSEGGNAWTSDRWKRTRDKFIDQGYAFLAVGSFGMNGTPEQLDRISLDAIHDAIQRASRHQQINKDRIALIGGSKGAELALLLASHFPTIKCVVAIVPCHAVFPALTLGASSSSWSYHDKEVPFVPVPWGAVPSLIRGDLRRSFELMIEDTAAVERARIPVEKIQGPILLLSATEDEMWPSTEMSENVIERLKKIEFPFPYEHIAIDGGHTAPLDHFDLIFKFLEEHFKPVSNFSAITIH
jgi:uncharacterized protein